MLAWSLTHRIEQTVSATMGTAGAFYSVPLNYQFHRRPLHFVYLRQTSFLLPVTWQLTTFSRQQIIKLYCRRSSGSRLLLNPARALLSSPFREESGSSSDVDPDLRSVLELATDSELYELKGILFGPSYFSPLLKSVTKRTKSDYVMVGEDPEERDEFLSMLESRFLYLAADARSTLRGRRPSYREVLLGVREKLSIRCSAKLSAEDLEAEIFLHLLQEYSSSKESLDASDGHGSLEFGLSKWKVQAAAAMKAGAEGVRSIVLKGGGALTLGKIYSGLARRFSGKMLLEAANYQISREVLKKGGEMAALNLESRLAMLAAKKGLAGAASHYFGLRSIMTFLGPINCCHQNTHLFSRKRGTGTTVLIICQSTMLDVFGWTSLWGTLLADVVIQMLGTDYARIVRAIYAFAQIRITRTYKTSDFQ